LAISDVFNTTHFATPLIELPIDKVTAREEQEYGWFRDSYMRLWTGYFDPIAMRYTLDEKRIRAQTHILPVVGTPIYRSLATLPLAKMTGKAPASTVAEVAVNVDANQTRLTFHVDEDLLLRDMIERLIRWEADPGEDGQKEYEQRFWKLPVAIGLHSTKGEDAFLLMALPEHLGNGTTRNIRYKDETIIEIPINAEKYRQIIGFIGMVPEFKEGFFASIISLVPTKEAPAALYAVKIGQSSLYVTPNADLPKKLIDQAVGKKDIKEAASEEINVRLTLSPEKARDAAGLLFEYEDHCLSLLNNEVWNCFYRAGILAADAPEKDRLSTARQFLGYVPVSPSGSPYERDPKTGEVVNRRHGTYRQPVLRKDVEHDSDLGRFLNQLRTIRAELRFQDNGIHAWLTIDRK